MRPEAIKLKQHKPLSFQANKNKKAATASPAAPARTLMQTKKKVMGYEVTHPTPNSHTTPPSTSTIYQNVQTIVSPSSMMKTSR
jgi:hypothetical protein